MSPVQFDPNETLGHTVKQRMNERLVELGLDGSDVPNLNPLESRGKDELAFSQENQRFYLEMESLDAAQEKKPWHHFPKFDRRYGEPVFVTVAMAEKLLGYNISNRRIGKKDVEKYARDMLAGNWFDTGESVQIDTKGNLVDGQHRLKAIVEAAKLAEKYGIPFEGCVLFVVWNVPPAARLVVDSGRKRPETYKVELLHGNDERLGHSAKLFAVCRAMMMGISDRATEVYSHAELGYFSQKYANEIGWAISHLKGIHRADVVAAVCKAYIWFGEQAMLEFCDKLSNVIFASKNDPVGQLYKFIAKAGRATHGVQVYKKALSAIDHYLHGREINRLREMDEDIFEWIGTWDVPKRAPVAEKKVI